MGSAATEAATAAAMDNSLTDRDVLLAICNEVRTRWSIVAAVFLAGLLVVLRGVPPGLHGRSSASPTI